MDREELEKKAQELNIEVEEGMSDEDLEAQIAKAADAANDGDDKELTVEDLKKEIEFYRKEAKKAFDSRDRSKQEKKILKQELDELKDKIGSAPSSDELKELKTELDELKQKEKERLEKQEEDELKNLSDREREKRMFNKELDKLNDKFKNEVEELRSTLSSRDAELSKKDAKIANLTKKTLEGEIARVASKLNALRPDLVVRLLKDDFTFNEALEQFIYEKVEKGKIVDDMTVEERVTEFLQDPENDILLKPEGSVSGVEMRQSTETRTSNSSKGKRHGYDPKDPKLIKEADMSNMDVDFYIETLIMRDKKLHKGDFADKK